MAGLLDRLSPREYAGAAIAAMLHREREACVAETAPSDAAPTPAEIAAAFDAGVPKEIDALAGAIVDRAARAAKAETRSTPELAQGSIELVKRVHKGVDSALDLVAALASGGGKALPRSVPGKSDKSSPQPKSNVAVAGGTGGGEAVTIDFEPDDGG